MGRARSQETGNNELRSGNHVLRSQEERSTAAALVAMLQSFSTGELLGSSEHWIIMARDKAAWNEFSTYFVQYVETHILRKDTRTSLARDAISTTQE